MRCRCRCRRRNVGVAGAWCWAARPRTPRRTIRQQARATVTVLVKVTVTAAGLDLTTVAMHRMETPGEGPTVRERNRAVRMVPEEIVRARAATVAANDWPATTHASMQRSARSTTVNRPTAADAPRAHELVASAARSPGSCDGSATSGRTSPNRWCRSSSATPSSDSIFVRLLLEPELLDSIEPDIGLVTMLVELNRVLPDETRATARQVIARVLADIEQRLDRPDPSGGPRSARPGHPDASTRDRATSTGRTPSRPTCATGCPSTTRWSPSD